MRILTLTNWSAPKRILKHLLWQCSQSQSLRLSQWFKRNKSPKRKSNSCRLLRSYKAETRGYPLRNPKKVVRREVVLTHQARKLQPRWPKWTNGKKLPRRTAVVTLVWAIIPRKMRRSSLSKVREVRAITARGALQASKQRTLDHLFAQSLSAT